MSNSTQPVGGTGQPAATAGLPQGRSVLRPEFLIFAVLLLLALIGAGLNEEDGTSRWVYWSVLVLVYGAVSVGWTWLQARRQGAALWPMIRGEVLHWIAALVAVKIVLLFELEGITARGAAADISLLVLALSTFMAGVQFNWSFMLLGAILAVTSIGLGFLDQLSIFVFTIPLAILALILVARHRPAA